MDRYTVESFLERIPHAGSIKTSGDWHLTCKCLMGHTHAKGYDGNASMTVSYDVEVPWAECFSCGYKRPLEATLNTLASEGRIDPSIALDFTSSKVHNLTLEPKIKTHQVEDYTGPFNDLRSNEYPTQMLEFLASKNIDPVVAKKMGLCWVPAEHSDPWIGEDDEGNPKKVPGEGIAIPIMAKGDNKTFRCVGAQMRLLSGNFRYYTLYKYRSSDRLFGEQLLPQADGRDLFLVEGPFDALHILSCGYLAVALLGTSLNDRKAELLKAAGAKRIHLFLDPDDAGKRGTKKAECILKEYGIPHITQQATKDPKHYSKAELTKLIRSQIQICHFSTKIQINNQ